VPLNVPLRGFWVAQRFQRRDRIPFQSALYPLILANIEIENLCLFVFRNKIHFVPLPKQIGERLWPNEGVGSPHPDCGGAVVSPPGDGIISLGPLHFGLGIFACCGSGQPKFLPSSTTG
jgi:hypothetical protein